MNVAYYNILLAVCGGEFWAAPEFMDRTGTAAIKYDPNGNPLWTAEQRMDVNGTSIVNGSALDAAGNLYFGFNVVGGYHPVAFAVYAYTNSGGMLWSAFPDNSFGQANGMVLDSSLSVLLVGQDPYKFSGAYSYYYTTFGLATNGSATWTNHFPLPPFGSSVASAIAADAHNNCDITGYSPDANGTNNIVTITYDTNGKQLWLQRYTGLGYGAVGNAIAADNNGNVYVAGYENVPGGGTEMVLIKYSPVTLQHQSNGNFLLEAQGSPNEPFDIQATTNLQTWLDLGAHDADTNGLLQYLDTNMLPYRFYLAIPQ